MTALMQGEFNLESLNDKIRSLLETFRSVGGKTGLLAAFLLFNFKRFGEPQGRTFDFAIVEILGQPDAKMDGLRIEDHETYLNELGLLGTDDEVERFAFMPG